MKLHVMGYGEHGKDTVAELLAKNLGITWGSSSLLASEVIIFPVLKKRYGYTTPEECFNDRRNHRADWHILIKEYGENDPARFSRHLFKQFNIYCGIRDDVELNAGRKEGLFDLAIWVDARDRKPPESRDSCKVCQADADIVIDNNGTEEQLQTRVANLCLFIHSIRRGRGFHAL